MIPKFLRSVSDFLYKHRARMYVFTVIVVLAGAVVLVSFRANELNKKAESLSIRLAAYESLAVNSEALSEEVSSLESEVRDLEAENEGLANTNEELKADIDALEEHSEVLLSEIQWVREAELREQP